MPLFKIYPADQPYFSAEVIVASSEAVLRMVQRLDCREADVERDGAYCFSVRLSDHGVWTIFRRGEIDVEEAIQSFG